MTNSAYSFLPWYRRGIAGLVTAPPAANKLRTSVDVVLRVEADPQPGAAPGSSTISRKVDLFGPGDVVGIDRRAIIRTDPQDWITNYEPNFLPLVEFYDEDFPWRYTPTGPSDSNRRLTPWLALVVLEASEFVERKSVESRPLPFIEANNFDAFPPMGELWAWAHVHSNANLLPESDNVSVPQATAVPRLEAALSQNPDNAYSRIISPRKLEANKPYHAFLVPVYETGRRAGLGLPLAGVPSALTGAWEAHANRPEPQFIPYYHRWYFGTGDSGGFEELVRLLKPQTVDPRVGYRDMDVQAPGANLPPISDAHLGGLLRLGGAMRAPSSALTPTQKAERDKYESWFGTYPHLFQEATASLINLADEYQLTIAPIANGVSGVVPALAEDDSRLTAADDEQSPDPIVTLPLYGRWHAAVDRLLEKADGSPVPNPANWIHELNLDPRHRVAAGAGTKVIQSGQEDYMTAAWSQVGEVLKANAKLRLGRFAVVVSGDWHDRRLAHATMSLDRLMRLTRPVHRRVLDQGKSVRAALDSSTLTASLLSSVSTRLLRPRGRLSKLTADLKKQPRDKLLMRLNRGELSPAPPKTLPFGLHSAEKIAMSGVKDAIKEGDTGDEAKAAFNLLAIFDDVASMAKRFDEIKKPEIFAIEDVESKEPRHVKETEDEAIRTYEATRDWLHLIGASDLAGRRVAPRVIDLPSIATSLVQSLEPRIAVRKRILRTLDIPPRLTLAMPEQFDEIMHHPVIDLPMYRPLEKISKDFLLPNLYLIPQNCITSVVTNQAFIESYMVGLNHEMSRELLWREYPTDQRGSVFRQFWDVKSLMPTPLQSPDDFREAVRDIPKIHMWPRKSKLGTHNHRFTANQSQENVVLVVRGELLKKYPNTVIYAQKANWGRNGAGTIDPAEERELHPVTEGQFGDPTSNRNVLRIPLFEAKIEPDIYFFGFDLTEADAIGRVDGPYTDDNSGWFFVLKERPGEPRFGFDAAVSDPVHTYNDLAWPHIIPTGSSRRFIDPGAALPGLQTFDANGPFKEKNDQRKDDDLASQVANSAAKWAYILYQAPVMVAIHGAELLKRT